VRAVQTCGQLGVIKLCCKVLAGSDRDASSGPRLLAATFGGIRWRAALEVLAMNGKAAAPSHLTTRIMQHFPRKELSCEHHLAWPLTDW
jgi:hypothetical protein